MSAFVCSNYHISALAVYAMQQRPAHVWYDGKQVELESAEQVATILYEQNLRSVNHRYYEAEPNTFAFDPRASRYSTSHTAVQIIKAAKCYDYQACETEDYETTLAKAIIEQIIGSAIGALPGYEAAEWGLTPPTAR